MKTKKALKKLNKIELLLSSIIDQYDTDGEPRLREALTAAKESLVRVKEAVADQHEERRKLRKPPAKAATSEGAALPRKGRKVRVAAASQ